MPFGSCEFKMCSKDWVLIGKRQFWGGHGVAHCSHWEYVVLLCENVYSDRTGRWVGSGQGTVCYTPCLDPQCAVLGVLTPISHYGVFHCVVGGKTYSCEHIWQDFCSDYISIDVFQSSFWKCSWLWNWNPLIWAIYITLAALLFCTSLQHNVLATRPLPKLLWDFLNVHDVTG